MQRISKQFVSIIAGLSVAGLAWAQGTQTQTSPGTVPVPKASPEPGPSTSTPSSAAPAKPAAMKPISKKPETISSTKQFAEHTGLARASEVIGLSVKDVADKDAGKIEDLMMDARGHVAYAVVSFGGILGMGDKLYAVPWDAVLVDREHKTAYLDVSKETLERAPSFTKDKWPEPSDRDWGNKSRTAWHDATITASVKSKLAREKAATLLKVNVDTNEGVVELNGNVDSERTKLRATELARQVEGVRKVVNNLKVQG
jgi:BON domain/PRC-barrel domain